MKYLCSFPEVPAKPNTTERDKTGEGINALLKKDKKKVMGWDEERQEWIYGSESQQM